MVNLHTTRIRKLRAVYVARRMGIIPHRTMPRGISTLDVGCVFAPYIPDSFYLAHLLDIHRDPPKL
jgi:hypothetical protein